MSAGGGAVEECVVGLGGLAHRAASLIVSRHRDRLPDLGDVVVLVPEPAAVVAMGEALRAAAGVPVLLLPRISTLAQWAAEVPLAASPVSAASRELALHAALSSRPWLAGADVWALCAELGGLIEELTAWNVELPLDAEDFLERLAAAYGMHEGASLRFEARLVHELWYAQTRDTAALGAQAAYALRLAALAETASAPLYVADLDGLQPLEEAFLERYARRAPVTGLRARADGAVAIDRLLHAAWPDAGVGAGLRERALGLVATTPRSPLAGRLSILGAASLEEEAQAIDTAVRTWLEQGMRAIAVVVNDRVVARRARALLERAGVLVRDEAGWPLSTTSAATVVGRLLDVVAGGCHHRDLLDLLKSPFSAAGPRRRARQRAVWRLERQIRSSGVAAGLPAFAAAAQACGDPEAAAALQGVQRAVAKLEGGRRPAAGWLRALDEALAELGVLEGLQSDLAGEQLVNLIRDLRTDVSGSGNRLGFSSWRRWFARKLESATFRDRGIDSPVVYTALASTRLRRFDAVVLCGCDAGRFPGPEPARALFNDGVRAELGLPTRAASLRQMQAILARLVADGAEILITWQRACEGEPNLLSPVIERLRIVHELAFGDDLAESASGERLAAARIPPPEPAPAPPPTRVPAPAAPAELVPSAISASGYEALVACPYRYFARHVLRLGEIDDVQEIVDRRDFGTRLHAVLAAFHRDHPVMLALGPDDAERALVEAGARVLDDAIRANYLSAGWLALWRRIVPHYVAWQREREARGWRFAGAEQAREREFTTPAGRRFTLVGRLDRIDQGPEGTAVLDYKTTRSTVLKRRLADPGEDVQLAVYTLLADPPVSGAAYVSLHRDEVRQVDEPTAPAELARAHADRLLALMDALHAGAALPAQGAEQVCAYCEMQGLCRRSHWP